MGSQASTVAFPLLVLVLTGSPAKAGVVGLAKWLPLALTALPAGMLADRFDRKRLMISSDAVRAVSLAGIPVALLIGHPPFIQVAAVAFLDGCLFTVRYVYERGALADVVRPEQVPDAVARNEARMFAANIVGPPLGASVRRRSRAAVRGRCFFLSGVDGVRGADAHSLPGSLSRARVRAAASEE